MHAAIRLVQTESLSVCSRSAGLGPSSRPPSIVSDHYSTMSPIRELLEVEVISSTTHKKSHFHFFLHQCTLRHQTGSRLKNRSFLKSFKKSWKRTVFSIKRYFSTETFLSNRLLPSAVNLKLTNFCQIFRGGRNFHSFDALSWKY